VKRGETLRRFQCVESTSATFGTLVEIRNYIDICAAEVPQNGEKRGRNILEHWMDARGDLNTPMATFPSRPITILSYYARASILEAPFDVYVVEIVNSVSINNGKYMYMYCMILARSGNGSFFMFSVISFVIS